MSDNAPWMDDDLRLFRQSVRKLVASDFLPHEERWRAQGYVDRDLWSKIGSLGFLCTDIPVEYGGGGVDFRYEAVLYEETWGRGLNGWAQSVHSILAHYILNFGSDAQKQKYLPLMASGAMVGAIAMTEPGTGSDLRSIRTTAVKDGDHYRINGSKIFISNGSIADLIAVVCRTNAGTDQDGLSLLLLETADCPGFDVGRILKKIGQKAQDTCELFFSDVMVPADRLLGLEEGRGFHQLTSELPYERAIVALCGVAAMEHILELTVDYVKQRTAFGKRLLDFQNTRFKLAEVKTTVHIARTFIDDCIQKLMQGSLDSVTASMAKWWVADMHCKVVDDCVQMFGGYGYMEEYPIARHYADARVQKIYAGTNEIMKELIARSL